MKNINIDWKVIALAIVFVIVVYFIVKPSKDKLEVKELIKGSKQATSGKISKAFSEDYFSKYCKRKAIKPTKYVEKLGLAKDFVFSMVEKLHGAKGLINDDEELVYTVYQHIPNEVIASMVAFAFRMKYNKNLKNFLMDFLDEKEIQKIHEIILSK